MRKALKPLRPDLSREARELAEELRRLYQQADRSMADLGSATPVARNSWSRYFGGARIPRKAMEILADIAGATPEQRIRLLDLWEAAERRHEIRQQNENDPTGPPQVVAGGAPGPEEPDDWKSTAMSARRGKLAIMSRIALAVLLVGISAAMSGDDRQGSRRLPRGKHRDALSAVLHTVSPACHEQTCSGKDPKVAHCDERAEGSSSQRFGANLGVRYSAVCATAWARVRGADPGADLEISNSHGIVQRLHLQGGGQGYTRMVPATRGMVVRTCLILHQNRRCLPQYSIP